MRTSNAALSRTLRIDDTYRGCVSYSCMFVFGVRLILAHYPLLYLRILQSLESPLDVVVVVQMREQQLVYC